MDVFGKEMWELLQVGDRVVYGIHGVCGIVDTQQRIIDRKKAEYYVLEPLDQPGSRFFVPMHNEAALSKMRPLLTVQQLEELLRSPRTQEDVWIADENKRKQQYRAMINTGDRATLICMVRCLNTHKNTQLAAGRKFHQSDEIFLKDAQKILTSEFSLVLNIPASDVAQYIERRINE